ncbi:BMP family ABC transporter substrate-binding protein, partial [Lactobacillus sp. XV13L]|nr:BMP family ABC transporter substrate-binding protein [Lactobacillus sp. XV13L]
SNESSYLGGVAAAYTTRTNKVGFIGGAKSAIIATFEAGFKQGVRDAAKALHKKITVSTSYIGNFTATDKAKSIAQSMYANHADVIYQAAGNAGNGVFQEGKAYNQARPASQKVWVIGVDVDQEHLGSYKSKDNKKGNFTLTSVLKGLNVATETLANDAAQGKFPGGKHLVYTLKGDGVS